MQPKDKPTKNYGFWNWGTGITITFIIAASLMLFLVYKTTTVSNELSEQNYYSQELRFNDQLEAAQNAATLSAPVKILQNESQLIITLPKECVEQKATGTVWIYRPSSEKNDLFLTIQPDAKGNMIVEKSKLLPGNYTIKTDWKMNGKDYYNEENIYVEKPAVKG